jgi:DNA-3-methyladenine glycosylase II
LLSLHIISDIDYLLSTDSVFKKSGITVDDFPHAENDPRSDDMFSSLMRTIVGQQLSTKAANTIWQRVVDGVDDISPKRFSKVSDDVLRGFGLSRQKISYMRGLCDDTLSKKFMPDALYELNDVDVLERIIALKGFGTWSAQMVMIFTLARRDIWPSGDLGIRDGVRLYKKLAERPDIAATEKAGNKFKGRRTAAALLMWKLKDKK